MAERGRARVSLIDDRMIQEAFSMFDRFHVFLWGEKKPLSGIKAAQAWWAAQSTVDAATQLQAINEVVAEYLAVNQELDDETLLKLNILLNTHLNGLSMEEINLGMIAAMKQQAGIHSEIVSEVIDAVADAIKADEDLEIYTSGANNIFRYPELADQSKASELINAFEEKQQLGGLIQESLADEGSTGIQVYIGDETPVQGMKDCSVVTATYELGEGMKGTIGIIGPKRMDYDKVIGTLRTVQNQLDDLYRKE